MVFSELADDSVALEDRALTALRLLVLAGFLARVLGDDPTRPTALGFVRHGIGVRDVVLCRGHDLSEGARLASGGGVVRTVAGTTPAVVAAVLGWGAHR